MIIAYHELRMLKIRGFSVVLHQPVGHDCWLIPQSTMRLDQFNITRWDKSGVSCIHFHFHFIRFGSIKESLSTPHQLLSGFLEC